MPPPVQQPDPWAEAAKNYKPQAASGTAPSSSAPNDDWKMWQPAAEEAPPQSLMKQAGGMAEDFGKGVIKGGLNTVNGVSSLIHKIPGGVGEALVPSSGLTGAKMYAQPSNTAQSIGKGVEQAGEFLLPGLGEEGAGLKLAEMAPQLGRAAAPLARLGVQTIGSGLINKTQGGSFSTGAAAGALGGGIGEGMRAAAPKIAETALGIPKAARAFGKTPGKAILEETSGVRPETIAASARDKMGQLTPELERAADAASVRPNQIRGLLPAPSQEIPLHSSSDVAGTSSRPISLHQVDRPMPRGLPVPSRDVPMAPGLQNEFPGRMASGTSSVRPLASEGPSIGMTHGEYIGEVPGERGGPGQVQGVVQHRPIVPKTATQTPIPSILPNPTASLGPARSVLSDAMGRAEGQNAEGLHNQLGKMNDFLGQRFSTGEAIPENVTPRDLLNLKRGFSEEHLRWSPETHDAALSAGRRAYGALDSELDRTVPAAAGLNQRISSLIPVSQRAESVGRNAGILQRTAGRIGAHTGAATMGVGGAYAGGREGGIPGAIAGGTLGILAPEMLSNPTAQMIMARGLYKNVPRIIPAAVGSGLQLDRKGTQ